VKRLLTHRKMMVILGLVVAGSAAGGAFAAFPDTNVDTYTGCLNAGGQIGQVANGLSPLKACGGNETLIHLGGGDITKVTAGSGLTGGGDNGAVTLSLAGGFQLPQSCAAGKIPRWDGTAWQCADQQTYSNGAGLDLTGNTFSVQSGYQLPQGCSNGQVATSKGDGTWKCQNSVGGLSVYTNWQGVDIDPLGHSETVGAYCNYGDVATGGGFRTNNADITFSEPDTSVFGNDGWQAHANGDFTGGHLFVYVKCLHLS
jgi:hypothetical protein